MAFFLWKKGMKDLMPPSHFLQKNNPKVCEKIRYLYSTAASELELGRFLIIYR